MSNPTLANKIPYSLQISSPFNIRLEGRNQVLLKSYIPYAYVFKILSLLPLEIGLRIGIVINFIY